MASVRRYLIKPKQPYFLACRTHDGRQLLIGPQWPVMVAVQFAPDGSFTNVVTKEFPDQQIGPLAPQSRRELRRWERELKAHDATISIKRFFIPERQIGIQDLPEHYLEFLANRDTYDEERRRELQSDVDNWLRDGDFVLYWTEDYYLDRTGEVVSS